MSRALIMLVLLVSLVSCRNETSRTWDPELNKIVQLDSVENVLIVPLNGCSGCIELGFQILKSDLDFTETAVILTRYDDQKIVNTLIKTIKEDGNFKEVLCDKENQLVRLGLINETPILIERNKRKLTIIKIDHDSFSTVLSAFKKK